jgi:hypothetical protein
MKAPITLTIAAATVVGALLPIAAQQTTARTPVSLVLLLDLSASVDLRQLELPRDVSGEIDNGLLARLTPTDRFGVGAFGAQVKFSGFLQGDRRARHAAVRTALKDRSAGLNGPSRVWDAIDEMVMYLESQPAPRAIIVITDGYASGNRLGLQDVVAHARTAHVVVSAIVNRILDDNDGPGALGSQRGLLQRLTADTGGTLAIDAYGDTFHPRKPGQFFEPMLDAIRQIQPPAVPAY